MNSFVRPVIKGKPAILLAIVLIGMLIYAPGLRSQDLSSYHNYADMTKEIKNLVNAHGSIAKIESIGKSLEGRDLWVITIANRNGTPTEERPGMFIGANFEGDHLIGSEISLSLIQYLLNNYGSDDDVKKSIDEHVYYIMPRLNPDGAEKMFASVKTGSGTNMFKYDGDNDGRMDEDGPEDLNRDGLITMMRVKDAAGQYTLIEDEPRLMKKAEPDKGEAGEYSIYWEGVDNDKDGFINEDPAGGVDINRNFQHAYPYFKDDAGWHMVSENESRALMDWILEHKNVAIMLNFGESDNLIVAPNQRGQLSSNKGLDLVSFANDSYSEAGEVGIVNIRASGRFSGMYGMFRMGREQTTQTTGRQMPSRTAATTFSTGDLEYFTKAGEKYRELTGIKKQPPLRDPKGAFFQYGYFQFGIFSFSTPGWGLEGDDIAGGEGRRPGAAERMPTGQAPVADRAGTRTAANRTMQQGAEAAGGAGAPGIDKDFLSYLEKNNKEGFIDWQPFDHPDLGEVEIGGFAPYGINNPAASEIDELGEAHAKFAVWLSDLYAEIKIARTEVINHGGGLFRIKTEIENSGFLPTALSQGVASRSVAPTMVQLGVDPKAIVSGNAKTNFFQSLDGSGNRQKYEWLIKGKSGDKIELKVVAQKAGTDKVNITLK